MALGPARTKDQLIADIKKRIIEEGDCWLWTGYCFDGNPVVSMKVGDKWVQKKVRKLLYDDAKQANIGRNYYLNRCGNKQCVNPEHTKCVTRKTHLLESNSKVSKVKRRLAASRLISMNSKINQEIADYMRISGKSAKELSEEFGLAVRTVHDVLNHSTWNRNNIFSGLFR